MAASGDDGERDLSGHCAGAFIDLCNPCCVVDDIPDSVTDFFEADEFVAQRCAEKMVFAFETKGARARDGRVVKVAGVLGGARAFGVSP